MSQTGRTKLPERPAVPISALLTADRRVRLGYISANFGDHPVTKAMLSIYKLHDRRKFKVLCCAVVMITMVVDKEQIYFSMVLL